MRSRQRRTEHPVPASDASAPIAVLVRAALARRKGLLFGWLTALAASSGASLALPRVLGRAVDALSGHGAINPVFILLGVVGVTIGVSTAVRYYFIACLGDEVVAELKGKLYSHALGLDAAFYDRVKPGEVATRIALDLTALQGLIGANTSIALRSVLTVLVAVAMLFAASPQLACWSLLVIPAVVAPFRMRSAAQRRLAARLSAEASEAQRLAAERLSAIACVRSHAREPHERALYQAALMLYRATSERFSLVRSALSGAGVLLLGAGLLLVLHKGAALVTSGALTGGELSQVALYASMAGLAGLELLEVWAGMDRMRGALDRLDAIARETLVVRDLGTRAFPRRPPTIRFETVTFRYPSAGRPALDGFHLDIPAGSTVALVGSSGAGKSSVATLLSRCYDPAVGQILVDGIDLRTFALNALRRGVAVVPQSPWLMHGTIAHNIAYAEPGASMERVERAARAVGADAFVQRLPQGYQTVVGEGGVALSGGQRQLLAIARAFLTEAPVVVLDEATSALDARSEQMVKAATAALRAHRTTVVIAHRLATVLEADRIAVMDQGRVVATGTHPELLRTCPLYHGFAALQLVADAPALEKAARDSLGQGEPRYIWG